MSEDLLVEEIHEVRRQLAAEFEGDVHAFFEYLRQRETAKSNVVTLEPIAPTAVHDVSLKSTRDL
jgi:hypothetical protein